MVCVVVLTAVAVGGMRSITFAQAAQFGLKFFALVVPAVILLVVWHHRGDQVGNGYPVAPASTVVTVAADVTVRVPTATTETIDGTVDGRAVDGSVALDTDPHVLSAGTLVTLQRGDLVPVIASLPTQSGRDWLRPLGSGTSHPLYASLSLTLAICLGTMGLPHVLVRFYTNPDGRDTRRTTLIVIAILSAFYLLPTIFGVLGRRYVPDLLLTGQTDATVLLLPERMLPGLSGVLLGALVTAGAFAAFLSTASGLTVSVAGVLSQDVFARKIGRRRTQRIRSFRISAAVAIVVPYLLSLPSAHIGLAAVVGLAFAVAASTFCPLLVLEVWWRRLTDAGAIAGLLVGGALATAAGARDHARSSRDRLAGSPSRPTRRLDRAADLHHHDRRLAADPMAHPVRRGPGDGAAARAGITHCAVALLGPLVAPDRPFVAAARPSAERNVIPIDCSTARALR